MESSFPKTMQCSDCCSGWLSFPLTPAVSAVVYGVMPRNSFGVWRRERCSLRHFGWDERNGPAWQSKNDQPSAPGSRHPSLPPRAAQEMLPESIEHEEMHPPSRSVRWWCFFTVEDLMALAAVHIQLAFTGRRSRHVDIGKLSPTEAPGV